MEHGLLEAAEDGRLFGSCDEAAKQISVACGHAAEAVVTMKLRAMDGEEHGITVTQSAPLRDMQSQICRLFRKRWQTTKAILTLNQTTYENVDETPFADCDGGETMAVVFVHADDPLVYGARKRVAPAQPPAHLELALATSPLSLPECFPCA